MLFANFAFSHLFRDAEWRMRYLVWLVLVSKKSLSPRIVSSYVVLTQVYQYLSLHQTRSLVITIY